MNDTYDAGYLPNDEDCDQDSIRVELAYSHDFYSSIIESKDERIAELEKSLKETREICDAVAHAGVDFGYGAYVLEDSVIHRARLILEALKEQGNG